MKEFNEKSQDKKGRSTCISTCLQTLLASSFVCGRFDNKVAHELWVLSKHSCIWQLSYI